MIVFNNRSDIQNIEKTMVALGNFDGLHIGHTRLIRRAVEAARETGLKSAVFTFSTHPRNAMTGRTVIKNIMSQEEKQRLIDQLGVDYLFSIPFSKEIHHMAPQVFIRDLLIGAFRMHGAFCGFNYHFGYKTEGNTEMLVEAAAREGFCINVMEPVIIDGELVSSSLIRGLISEGKMERCARYLGRHYAADGEVVVGNKIGRTIGFPTTNIVIDETMVVPSHGVYVTNCHYDGRAYPGVTNVGIRPTIGDEKKTVETHMFDFTEELYGKHISVEFLNKLRDEIKFENVDALAAQIARDSEDARLWHRRYESQKRDAHSE